MDHWQVGRMTKEPDITNRVKDSLKLVRDPRPDHVMENTDPVDRFRVFHVQRQEKCHISIKTMQVQRFAGMKYVYIALILWLNSAIFTRLVVDVETGAACWRHIR